jgi:hypothetical protein
MPSSTLSDGQGKLRQLHPHKHPRRHLPYCTSTLELPQSVGQNARLTLTMNYGIEYINPDYLTVGAILNLNPHDHLGPGWVAGWDDGDGVIMRDGTGRQFMLSNWDFLAETNFYQQFKRAAESWDNRFRLIPPTGYSGLDYFQQMGDVFRLSRPVVECRFRAVSGGEPEHLVVYGVRPQDWRGREFAAFTKYNRHPVVMVLPAEPHQYSFLKQAAHELGHALRNGDIGQMLRTPGCPAIAQACYEPSSNVMGNDPGMDLLPVNAVGWQAAIEKHTGVSTFKWQAVVI